MRDVRRYWQEVRVIEAGLPEFVWLVGDGPPVHVPAAQAALFLHAKSHRIAEDSEIAAHQAAEHEQDFQTRREQLRRQGVAVVRPPLPR